MKRRLLTEPANTPHVEPLLVRPRDAAKALAVSQRTIERLIASGRLRTVKTGPSRQAARLIPTSELRRFVEDGLGIGPDRP